MEETLVTLETAKLAFEKGFDLDCRYAYDEKEDTFNSAIYYNGNEFFSIEDIQNAIENTKSKHYLAPSQSILQRWLREEYGIHVQPQKTFHNSTYIIGKIPTELRLKEHPDSWNHPNSYFNASKKKFKAYESALEEGLKLVLKNIVNKKQNGNTN